MAALLPKLTGCSYFIAKKKIMLLETFQMETHQLVAVHSQEDIITN